ncbi:MAG: hypothetical protein JWL84_3055 [Rhodospirillales bacterium]|nr:hypothetical protein [Rhodospirillales bacterium]
MSDAKGQQNEPSMEEILASIRRIIAEDGDTPAAGAEPAAPVAPPPAAAAAPPPPPPQQHEPDDILELTDVVEPDGTVVSLNAAKAAEPPRRAPPPEPPRQEPQFEEAAPDERIVSAHTAAAAVGAFSQLSALRDDARARDIGLGAGHLTLEAIVREELRPILRNWLDANLPNMVERLVQQEIARLVSDVQRR